ncbi:MAG: uridine kinase [Mariprofundaceae bacterium]
MRGDVILVEEHHARAGKRIVEMLLSKIAASGGKYAITVAGESGSGKSETATAIANALAKHGIHSVILQQDDYYVHPPKTNDRTRREDPDWLGPMEVRLDVLDSNVRDVLDGKNEIDKPLVDYDEDRITTETMPVGDAGVVIAEGTYTTLLKNADTRIFITRDYHDTRAHREKRNRAKSELDDFTTNILVKEHEIISSHKAMADIVITSDYDVVENG